AGRALDAAATLAEVEPPGQPADPGPRAVAGQYLEPHPARRVVDVGGRERRVRGRGAGRARGELFGHVAVVADQAPTAAGAGARHRDGEIHDLAAPGRARVDLDPDGVAVGGGFPDAAARLVGEGHPPGREGDSV